MKDTSLSALLAWNRSETARWQAWFAEHPAGLDVTMGTGSGTVRQEVLHVFAVDLRLAQRLLGQPVSSFEHIVAEDSNALFGLGHRAHTMLARWLAQATSADMQNMHVFTTRNAGNFTVSSHKLFLHVCTHHIRHWAQVAAFLRAHGQAADWPHDFILSDALK